MKSALDSESVQELNARLSPVNEQVMEKYPGDKGERQPVHTVYGGAHLFKADTAVRLGKLALRALEEYGRDAGTFASAIGLGELGGDRNLAARVWDRVMEKLRREPVEDFRIDFEDGYGNRPEPEEDAHAEAAANEVAAGLKAGTLPPFIGIRIKPFTAELVARSLRTLDIFVSTLLDSTAGSLPPNFFVTLPKITAPEQVGTLASAFDELEKRLGLAQGSLRLEMMIETTQSIINHEGQINLPLLLEAARGRCTAAHFGTYDYTAACNITAAHQDMLHPACDFARNMMQVAFAGTGLWLSDGATNIMPVAPHRRVENGPELTDQQKAENLQSIHRAWRLHAEHIRHSLVNGYYQGWDLHPAQLPTRYAAVYAFFLESLDSASERLSNFVDKAAKATLVGDVFDDAATGQGLLNYFLRAINCGAISEEEAVKASSLSVEEIRSGSFIKILKNRQKLT
jgi:citrate lyase beta subunit